MPWRSTPGEPMACARAMPLSIASRASPRRAERGQREADVDRQHRLARLEPGRARRARGAAAGLEGGAHLAARLTHHRERLPGIDGRARDVVLLRQGEQRVGRLGRLVQLSGVGVSRRERRRAPRLLVGQPRLLRGAPDLVEPRARLGVAAARVLVAHACAPRAHLARLVVDRLLHRAHGRVALAGARVETVPRLVEQLRAGELRRLVLGEGQRLLRQRRPPRAARAPRGRGARPSPGTPRRPSLSPPRSRCRATMASSSPIFASQRPARACDSRSASSPSEAYATSRISACLKANSRVPVKRACACSTRISAAASSRSASAAFGDADGLQPDDPTRPARTPPASPPRRARSRRARRGAPASPPRSSGASDASRPAAARRASSSANSGSPADCCAIESSSASPRSPVARSPRMDAAIARDWLARQRTQLDADVISSLEARGVVAPEAWAAPPRGRRAGWPAARASRWSIHAEALGVGPLRVLEDDRRAGCCAPCPRHVREREPERVARAARVVELRAGPRSR